MTPELDRNLMPGTDWYRRHAHLITALERIIVDAPCLVRWRIYRARGIHCEEVAIELRFRYPLPATRKTKEYTVGHQFNSMVPEFKDKYLLSQISHLCEVAVRNMIKVRKVQVNGDTAH